MPSQLEKQSPLGEMASPKLTKRGEGEKKQTTKDEGVGRKEGRKGGWDGRREIQKYSESSFTICFI